MNSIDQDQTIATDLWGLRGSKLGQEKKRDEMTALTCN